MLPWVLIWNCGNVYAFVVVLVHLPSVSFIIDEIKERVVRKIMMHKHFNSNAWAFIYIYSYEMSSQI